MGNEKNTGSAVLSLNAITKSYGPVQALKGVSFEVPEGSVFGILGPNGSGKTTLLSIILDVLKANKGNFLWFGHPGSREQRQKIGSLLETPNFYHYLSAVNNLKITQSISERGKMEDIDQVLKKVRLYERRNSRFSTFSLGMKQRLAIAAALLVCRNLWVLAEYRGDSFTVKYPRCRASELPRQSLQSILDRRSRGNGAGGAFGFPVRGHNRRDGTCHRRRAGRLGRMGIDQPGCGSSRPGADIGDADAEFGFLGR